MRASWQNIIVIVIPKNKISYSTIKVLKLQKHIYTVLRNKHFKKYILQVRIYIEMLFTDKSKLDIFNKKILNY